MENVKTGVKQPVHACRVRIAKTTPLNKAAYAKPSFRMVIATQAQLPMIHGCAKRPAVFATAKTTFLLYIDNLIGVLLWQKIQTFATQTQVNSPMAKRSADGPVIFAKVATSPTPQPLATVIYLLTPAVLFLV